MDLLAVIAALASPILAIAIGWLFGRMRFATKLVELTTTLEFESTNQRSEARKYE